MQTFSSLRLPRIFGDHMVIQRRKPIVIYGVDRPGQSIVVSMGNRTIESTQSADDGSWAVTLPAKEAGGSYTITVVGSGVEVLRDVVIGDVWVCSGQSNMEWPLCDADDATRAIAEAGRDQIRLFIVSKVGAFSPAADCSGQWNVCTPESAKSFSAVGFFFGRSLSDSVDVPIGLVQSAWGGTKAENWTSLDALRSAPSLAYLALTADEATARNRRILDDHQTRIPEPIEVNIPPRSDGSIPDPGRRSFTAGWESPQFNDAAWPSIDLPVIWETTGLLIDGAVWFRRTIDIPEAWAGKPLTLNLGAIDDFDITWWNGEAIGSTDNTTPNWWVNLRHYTVPGHLVHAGRNVIVCRVFDQFINGGFAGPATAMTVHLHGEVNHALPVNGPWKYTVELAKVTDDAVSASSTLFNGMIAPLLKTPIAGVIWYQGESNADRPEEYRTLLSTMIRDWRSRWGVGDFPFYIVQLANFNASGNESGTSSQSDWATLRESQRLVSLCEPNCGLVSAIDIGDSADIHPRNKQEVGRRLALQALAKYYKREVSCESPQFHAVQAESQKLIVTVKTFGRGVKTRDGQPARGFVIRNKQGNWLHADCMIDAHGTLVLDCQPGTQPTAVRYAWADDPDCNVSNNLGLPLLPFHAELNAETAALRAGTIRAS